MGLQVLDNQRERLVPGLSRISKDFYLAGGTALALQLEHRVSIDFDFFTLEDIDTAALFEQIKTIFPDSEINKIQEEHNTLTVIIDNVSVSFFTYKYPLLQSFIDWQQLRLASIEDIAAMKLSAITSRATEKDYVDLYFILQQYDLRRLLELANQKFPELDTNLILKSLSYFEDIIDEPVQYLEGYEIEFNKVQIFLAEQARKYLQSRG